MKIYINGEERDATPAEEAEILAAQASVPVLVESPVTLRQIAGARLIVDQVAWDVSGVERSTGISGAFLVDTDIVYVFFTEAQPDTFYDVIPSTGVTKYTEFVEVTRPNLAELNFIVQRVQ